MTRLHLVSRRLLLRMSSAEKVRFILDEVKAGRVLVLPQPLAPHEETKLIEHTMREIRPDGFAGLDLESHPREAGGTWSRALARWWQGEDRLTIVAPAERIETLRKAHPVLEVRLHGSEA